MLLLLETYVQKAGVDRNRWFLCETEALGHTNFNKQPQFSFTVGKDRVFSSVFLLSQEPTGSEVLRPGRASDDVYGNFSSPSQGGCVALIS